MMNVEIFPNLSVIPDEKAPVGVIVLCRGALGSEAKGQLQQLVHALQEKLGHERSSFAVHLAHIDRHGPSLVDALDACANCQRVLICPLMWPDEPALRRWLDKVVLRWRSSTGNQLHVGTMAPVASLDDFPEWLGKHIRSSTEQPLADVGDELDEWERDPVGWSSVPEHKRLVLWCTGPRCAAKGAFTLWPKLTNALLKHHETRKNTLVMQTTCQYPCNRAPVMCVQPDDVWYGEMDEEKILALIENGFKSKQKIINA